MNRLFNDIIINYFPNFKMKWSQYIITMYVIEPNPFIEARLLEKTNGIPLSRNEVPLSSHATLRYKDLYPEYMDG